MQKNNQAPSFNGKEKESEKDLFPVKPKEDEYTPKESEKDLFHAILEKPLFNTGTGERLSNPYLQKFTPREWKVFIANAEKLGYTVNVTWNPEEKAKTN